MMMTLSKKDTRSYKTLDGLMKALKDYGFANDRHLVVCTEDGRYTAIFPASNVQGGYIGRYACRGFFTIG